MEHDDRGCRIPSPQRANGGTSDQGWTSAGPEGRAAGPYRTRGGARLRTELPGMMTSSEIVLADAAPDLAGIGRAPFPSLAELAGRIDAADLSPVAKRDLRSALTRVAGWIGETPAMVPADPAWLRRRTAGWTGARFGVSAASFSVVLSQLRRALRYAGPPPKVALAQA